MWAQTLAIEKDYKDCKGIISVGR